jgi:putative ABC transport system permease protein
VQIGVRLLWSNLWRAPARTSLTILGTAIALALFCLLAALQAAFGAGVEMASAARLVVQHKESLAFLLPEAYRAQIAQLDGVRDLALGTWFGGLSEEPLPGGDTRRVFFPNFAVDLEAYLRLYPEMRVPPEQVAGLLRDRAGCLIGAATAKRLGKKVGDRLSLTAAIWPKPDNSPWEFTVRAIYTPTTETFDPTLMLFHHRYLDETRSIGKGLASFYIVGLTTAERSADVAAAIDRRFANSPYPSRTVNEKAFNLQFVSLLGNLKLLFRFIGSVVIFTMLLVSANTMMMSGRERTREMAILKALGFSDGRVFGLLVGEAVVISLLAYLIGAGGMYALINLARWNPKPDFFPIFRIPVLALLGAFGIAVLTGVVSGLIPGVAALRLRPAEALRSL